VTRPALVVHGHFYQPPRLDPFRGTMPLDPTAAPAHDWNERISADCYRPNAEIGNLGAMSWDLGPTLAGWMERGDPVAYRGFVEGDAGHNGMAQPFHHAILPLSTTEDRRTEIRWGLRDFEFRFGRRPAGLWLPETAVDLPTLRLLADEGVTYTILAPWQVDGGWLLDTRRPVRIDLGDERSIIAVLYDAPLSTAVSFQPEATSDADAFVRDLIMPRLGAPQVDDGPPPLVVIATDGELYGHHQPFREHFLARLVGRTASADLPYDSPSLDRAIAEAASAPAGLATVVLLEHTSWSCHHGTLRWSGGCGCVERGDWKAPLRAALDRLAGGIDAATDHLAATLPGAPDPWQARDAYVDVVIGAQPVSAFTEAWLAPPADAEERGVWQSLMEAQRWRLAMYASCAWFWEVPERIETAGALRAAVRAARLIDGLASTDLERRLIADLGLLDVGQGVGVDLLRLALSAVGAPMYEPRNPSARGLRATG
jgi:Domain of unknown function (DUF3536)/Glycosyl hydrolase family 57